MGWYVKTGLAGYGADLEEWDEPTRSWQGLCYSLEFELRDAADRAVEMAAIFAEQGEYELAYRSRVKADELEVLKANLDWDKRLGAPLYAGDEDKLAETMESIVAENFPLDLDVEGRIRLYVLDEEV